MLLYCVVVITTYSTPPKTLLDTYFKINYRHNRSFVRLKIYKKIKLLPRIQIFRSKLLDGALCIVNDQLHTELI
jgi:hypothetical protein